MVHMPGMTLRLDDEDHFLLRTLALIRHKPANQIIIELLRAEYDREYPGRREARAKLKPGELLERFRVAMGWDELPKLTPEEEREFQEKLRAAQEDARRIYGEPAEEAA